MPEITPRLTFSPEGILELSRKFNNENDAFMAHIGLRKAELLEQPGYEVVDDGAETTVKVDVAKVLNLKKRFDNSYVNPNAENLVRNLAPFAGFSGYVDETEGALDYFVEPNDNVFSLRSIHAQGAVGIVYPQLQRWLNAGGLDEQAAKDCLESLAFPFGIAGKRMLKRESAFNECRTDGKNSQAGVGGFGFSVASHYAEFRLAKLEKTEDGPVYKQGKVQWNWVDLSTVGSCACWGVTGDDRQRVKISASSTELYEMYPHNVESGIQSLSLILGMGALAYAAARYEGKEDILADVEWRAGR